jgi:hypothetical protein
LRKSVNSRQSTVNSRQSATGSPPNALQDSRKRTSLLLTVDCRLLTVNFSGRKSQGRSKMARQRIQ